MKEKVLRFKKVITVVVILAMLSLIGIGFATSATWEFSDDATKTVTTVVDTGSADDATSTLTPNVTAVQLVLEQNDTYWVDQNGTKITTVTLEYAGTTETAVEETINFSVTVTNGASTYVTLGAGSFSESSKTYTGTKISVTYTLPTITWTDKYPKTRTAYDTMKSAVGSVSFEFKAAVAA